VPRLCELYLGICLTTEEKARKSKEKARKSMEKTRKNGDMLFKLNLKCAIVKCHYKVFCIFVLGQDVMMAPSQSRIHSPENNFKVYFI
jgi:hypothetical protein